MIDQFTNLEDGDIALPTSSLDLSARMRDLRARQGLKQSEVARRMGLDPSIPSLWEQGKRLVPANRVRALADALEVSVEELLEGVSGAQRVGRQAGGRPRVAAGVAELIDDRAASDRRRSNPGPLLRLLPRAGDEQPVDAGARGRRHPSRGSWPSGRRWTAGSPTVGSPADRIQDISPSLPDGYWLDPIKLEKRHRAAAAAQPAVRRRQAGRRRAGRAGRGAGRADLQPLRPGRCFMPAARLPLAETIFRCVLAADHGGLTDGALVEMLRERTGAVPVSATLLRRMRDSVRPYPIRRVDAELFGGRR